MEQAGAKRLMRGRAHLGALWMAQLLDEARLGGDEHRSDHVASAAGDRAGRDHLIWGCNQPDEDRHGHRAPTDAAGSAPCGNPAIHPEKE